MMEEKGKKKVWMVISCLLFLTIIGLVAYNPYRPGKLDLLCARTCHANPVAFGWYFVPETGQCLCPDENGDVLSEHYLFYPDLKPLKLSMI